jgi:uncharacterized protein (DUF2126 family)
MLYLFLPPTDYLEDYVDLITSIEITAEKSYKCQCVLKVTNLKLIIELKKMMVTLIRCN